MMLHPTHAILHSQNEATRSRRTLSIALVAALHVLLIGGLLSGMVQPITERIKDIEVFIPKEKEEAKPPEKLPPPDPVRLKIDEVFVPEPIFTVENGERMTALTGTTSQPPVTPAPTIPDSGPVAANARTLPPYPAFEARMGAEGQVTMRVSISEAGLVTAADLVKSSGWPNLDRLAINWVIAHWKYKPAIRDGQPVASTTEVTMNFTLTGRR